MKMDDLTNFQQTAILSLDEAHFLLNRASVLAPKCSFARRARDILQKATVNLAMVLARSVYMRPSQGSPDFDEKYEDMMKEYVAVVRQLKEARALLSD
jgi:hypothetical protein